MSIKGSRSKSLNLETDPFYYYQKNNASTDKIKFENNLTEINNDNDYSTKEIELDINNHNNKYNSREFEFDINTL
ncbi:unnamed protein product [Rhizophagus irregularis]|nr:unnamed protein product [Rhizophagus irregularis]